MHTACAHTPSTAPPWNSAVTSTARIPGPTNRSPKVSNYALPQSWERGYGPPGPHIPLGGLSAPWGDKRPRRLCEETELLDFPLVARESPPLPALPSHPCIPPTQFLPPKRAPQGVRRQGDDCAFKPSASQPQPPQVVPRLRVGGPPGIHWGLTVESAPGDLSPHHGQQAARPPPFG